MKKNTRFSKLVAILMSIVLVFSVSQHLSVPRKSEAATNVKTSIAVSSTVTSSKSISEQTKNDEYKVRDAICSLNDGSINRATSEHFQIIWGNGDTTGTVNYEFVVGNLINLENIRTFYIEELGMKDIGTSQNKYKTGKYKTNVYISGTGLPQFEDDWAYMSVDADSFGYLFVAPGAMRVDEPSWVIPHELAHVFTYHQGGSIGYAWYESIANWFRDQYLGSEYYAYGGRTYGPTSDFFAPYMLNSSYHVPHMLNWYDTWPIFLYISENPDNIDGLGMELMRKICQYDGANESMYDVIEKLSGVSIKTILGGMSRRLATMDFSRQEHYLNRLNNETLRVSGNYAKIYTTLNSADSNGWQSVPSNRAPMQTGFNIIPLNVDLSKDKITVEFASTSSAKGADFRTSIVTSTAKNVTRYSNTVSGNGTAEITLKGDETKAYLVVCATPDTVETFNVDWNSKETDASTRFTYKVRIKAVDVLETPTTAKPTTKPTTQAPTTAKPTTKPTTQATTTAKPTTQATTTAKPTTQTTVGTKYTFEPSKGLNSNSYFSVSGNIANNKGSVTYNGTTLSKCLKVESKTSIKFTTKTDGAKLTLIVKGKKSGCSIKVNGSVKFSGIGTTAQTKTITLGSAGEYKITRGSGESYIYYLVVEEAGNSSTESQTTTKTTVKPTTQAPTTAKPTTQATTTEKQTTQATQSGSVINSHNFSSDGLTDGYYSVYGNISSSKGTVTYNGMKLTRCLKLESSTRITFTTTGSTKLVLVLNPSNSSNVKVDGKKYTMNSQGVVTVDLKAGTHTITKASSGNLYYIELIAQ